MNERKIKAIAFDLVGVLLKENDYPLFLQEQILEKQFGNINFDHEFYSWATKQLNTSQDHIRQMVQNIVFNIYEFRDPEILSKISSDFPSLKLAIASNHISAIKIWIDKKEIRHYFHTIVVSAELGAEKPDPKFYEILVQRLGERPDEILFVDDLALNVDGAKRLGLSAIHYKGTEDLLTEIKRHIRQ